VRIATGTIRRREVLTQVAPPPVYRSLWPPRRLVLSGLPCTSRYQCGLMPLCDALTGLGEKLLAIQPEARFDPVLFQTPQGLADCGALQLA
jgi:hypothetical protein